MSLDIVVVVWGTSRSNALFRLRGKEDSSAAAVVVVAAADNNSASVTIGRSCVSSASEMADASSSNSIEWSGIRSSRMAANEGGCSSKFRNGDSNTAAGQDSDGRMDGTPS